MKIRVSPIVNTDLLLSSETCPPSILKEFSDVIHFVKNMPQSLRINNKNQNQAINIKKRQYPVSFNMLESSIDNR